MTASKPSSKPYKVKLNFTSEEWDHLKLSAVRHNKRNISMLILTELYNFAKFHPNVDPHVSLEKKRPNTFVVPDDLVDYYKQLADRYQICTSAFILRFVIQPLFNDPNHDIVRRARYYRTESMVPAFTKSTSTKKQKFSQPIIIGNPSSLFVNPSMSGIPTFK